jgi:hypothetical protein
LCEVLQRLRLFERRQILPLDVFHERQLDDFGIVDVADDDRQVAKPNLNGSLVATLAGDDLKAVAARPGR